MRHFLVMLLLALTLVACSSPAGMAAEVTEPSPPAVEPRSEPTEASSPPAQPTPQPTNDGAEPLTGIQNLHPSEVDNSTLPITPVEDLHLTGLPLDVDISTYRLVVEGLVNTPLSLSYDDLLSRPQVTEEVLLICPGFFWDNAIWTGTALRLILEEAGLSSEASEVRFEAGDGYARTMPLADALGDGVFLAHDVNGVPLPKEHGYPIRVVARHQYGSWWVKWLRRIEVR